MKNTAFFVAVALAAVFIFTACDNSGGDDTVTLTEITVAYTHTVYLKDSTFNNNGIRVDALYSDGNTAIIRDYTMTGFDSMMLGEQTLTIYYQGKSVSFDITIVEQGSVDMAEVTGGKWFSMGSDIEGENPPHNVILTCFYMGKYEITQKEYSEIMGINPSAYDGEGRNNFPVEQVSWYDAVEFCNKLSELDGLTPAYTIDKNNQDHNNTSATDTKKWKVALVAGADGYRLPTEAEWEYACRAGTITSYNVPDPLGADTITTGEANFISTGTKAVGSFVPNNWGLYDMHGNVGEWCWDWYDAAWYSGNPPAGNPTGPASGEYRVFRGGAWSSTGMVELRSSFREKAGADDSRDNLGFRVLRPKYPEGIPR